MSNLYLRIYATVVAVLLVFALIGGWFAQHHVDRVREQMQAAAAEDLAAAAAFIERNLPSHDAPVEEQREALLELSRRHQRPLALDAPDGSRIGESPDFARAAERASGVPERRVARVALPDGRTLWLWRAVANRRAMLLGARPAQAPPLLGGPPPEGAPLDAGPAGPAGPGPRPWWDTPPWLLGGSGLAITLALLYVAVALGAYPVVRRLTRRLESLKRGVEAFGAGALHHRVDAAGRDEVASLATSFNQAAERIEALVTAHRSLLANASHELRSPLARLKMALAMLETARQPDAQQRLRDEIEHNIRELDALVEEVLLASRLEARREDEAQDRVELLPLAAEEAARQGASVEGEDLAVSGSERLLRRALRNLIENAVRYGGSEPPDVEIHRVVAASRVQVSVCDRGPGVPEAERERIFEPFYRLPGHAEQAGGVGLGLSLVRQIAQRHGGSVRVEPREGGGSRFVMELPLAADPAPARPAAR